jgi:hypothetical protein
MRTIADTIRSAIEAMSGSVNAGGNAVGLYAVVAIRHNISG